MTFKKLSLFLISTFMIVLLVGNVVSAQNVVDENIPESWNEDPKSASEMGISEFNQSPILDEKIENGELPPVEERLPEDPPVMEPYKEVGNYGGTVHVWDIENGNYEIGFWRHFSIGVPTPQGKVVPNMVKSWEYSNNKQNITFELYKGLKWSDGNEFNADDFLYYWEHEAQNKDLHPVAPEKWSPSLQDITAEGKYKVTFHFGVPVPTRMYSWKYMAGSALGSWTAPAEHFHKNYHPDFVSEEELNQKMENAGYDGWSEFYTFVTEDGYFYPNKEGIEIRPSLGAYIIKEKTQTREVWVRNPYYPYVDTEGNQLPYVDEIVVHKANDPKMAATKAATGEATIAARHLQTNSIPLYKRNEQKENYKTLIFNRAYGSEVAIMPNLTHPDKRKREIFQNKKFRQALSLAIDRDEINEKVYFGQAVPRQATVLPTSDFFKQEYANAYSEHDPERAKELLNQIGIKDSDGDGKLEGPDGKSLNLQIQYCKIGPIDPTPVLELIIDHFSQIGLDINIKMVSREYHDRLWQTNEGKDMHVWTLDGVVGKNLLTPGGLRFFAPLGQMEYTQWPGWASWNNSDGEQGIEPPQEIKELIKTAESAMSTLNSEEQAQKIDELLKAQADNIRMIGTVGLGPNPVIVKNKLKNVPTSGLWDAKLQYLSAYRPQQFYIEEDEK